MYFIYLLLTALLSAGLSFSSPLPESDFPTSLSSRDGEVEGPPWPEVYFEPLNPDKNIRLFACPSFNEDCFDSSRAVLVDIPVDELDDGSQKQTSQALCKYQNGEQEWFIKQREGWYMSEEDIHIKDTGPGSKLDDVKDLPHCLHGNVTVIYYDTAGNKDEDSATPGGCIKRKIHTTFFVPRSLEKFESGRNRKLNSDPAVYPTIWCRAHADDNCNDPTMGYIEFPTIRFSHLYSGALSQDEREAEEDKILNSQSFQCF